MVNTKRSDDYYDEEAAVYSQKRYPERVQNYTQFLFTRRRALVLEALSYVVAHTKEPRALLEIGCADGVLLRSIVKVYPRSFSHIHGIDTAKQMIDTARALTHEPEISFGLRNSDPVKGRFTIILEIGVAAIVLESKSEIDFFSRHLEDEGYVVVSVAGNRSIVSLLDKGAGSRNKLQSYQSYEKTFRERFTILYMKPLGIYVPLLWRAPQIARTLQPLFEFLGNLFPGLAHEHLYILKKL